MRIAEIALSNLPQSSKNRKVLAHLLAQLAHLNAQLIEEAVGNPGQKMKFIEQGLQFLTLALKAVIAFAS
jgi:hypothetical protein